jgi:hypothetical protein
LWLAKVGTGSLYIEPASPWENGDCESFNGKLPDKCANRKLMTPYPILVNYDRIFSGMGHKPSPQHFWSSGVSSDMRLRLLIYALASLILLVFHAPVRAVTSLFTDCREL